MLEKAFSTLAFKRAKDDIYTISAVSIIGADIPGGGYKFSNHYCHYTHNILNTYRYSPGLDRQLLTAIVFPCFLSIYWLQITPTNNCTSYTQLPFRCASLLLHVNSRKILNNAHSRDWNESQKRSHVRTLKLTRILAFVRNNAEEEGPPESGERAGCFP